MGLFSLASRLRRKAKESGKSRLRRIGERVCRFEQLEPRIALSATPGPELIVGAVFAEQSSPETGGDRFEIVRCLAVVKIE